MKEIEFYRHFKGHVYKILAEAKDSSTQEPIIVYQGLYGDSPIWARKKAEFFEDVDRNGKVQPRFKRISIDEVDALVEPIYSPKYNFPSLDYTNEFTPLTDSLSSSVARMIKLLSGKQLLPVDFPLSPMTDDEIEDYILEKIRSYSEGDSLCDIFNAIQIWGGSSGRNIYNFSGGFNWATIEPQYRKLVESCLAIKENTDDTRTALAKATQEFCAGTKNINIAFATKHTRFWTYRVLGMNALPIYDRIMAAGVMKHKEPTSKGLTKYWNIMTKVAEQLDVELMPLERQLFKYFSSE